MLKAGAYFIAAVGQQQEERLCRTASRQVMEEFQAGIITPMQVLDDEQQGLHCCLAQEEVSQGGEETAFLLLRIERWQGRKDGQIGEGLYDIREQWSKLTSKRTYNRLSLCCGRGEEE